MNKRSIVFLDVDGVLSDLWGALYKAHNKPYDPDDPSLPVGKEAYSLHNVFGISWEDLWKPYKESFVSEMNKLSEADEIVRIINPIDKDWDVAFLTCPLPNRLNGRYGWLKKNYPGIPVIIADDKSFCCQGPHTLLIDDYDKNIDTWEMSGGSTIMFPRRWNSRYVEMVGYFPELFERDFSIWRNFRNLKSNM